MWNKIPENITKCAAAIMWNIWEFIRILHVMNFIAINSVNILVNFNDFANAL